MFKVLPIHRRTLDRLLHVDRVFWMNAFENKFHRRFRRSVILEDPRGFLGPADLTGRTGSFGWSVSTGEISWSEEASRIFQYDRTTKPTVELILKRVHPEDAVHVKQTIESASVNGKDFEHECRLVMPDNSVKYVHVVAHALTHK